MHQKITVSAVAVIIGAAIFLAGRGSVSPAAGELAETAKPQGSARSAGASGDSSRPANRGKNDRRTASGTARPATGDARRAKLESILQGEDPMDRNRGLLGFLDQLSPSELQEAVGNFASLGIPGDRSNELAMLLSAWTKSDPDAAIDWARTNGGDDAKSPYIAGIIRSLAASDLARASGLLSSLPAGKVLEMAVIGVLPLIRAQGDDATRAWISGLQSDQARNAAVGKVANDFVLADFKSAAIWLAANPCEAATRHMHMAVGSLAHQDQEAAIAIYEGLPAGEARSEALGAVMCAMLDEDPQVGASFIEKHLADVNDGTLKLFGIHTITSNPDLALSYLARIRDPEAREASRASALTTFVASDLPAAKAYFQTHPRPDQLAPYVEQMLDR